MTHWWIVERERFLDSCLAHINSSKRASNSVTGCRSLFDALNKAWDSFYVFRKNDGQLADPTAKRSDHADIRDLISLALGDKQLSALCHSTCVEQLALFEPQVMNHQTLKSREYSPSNISPELARDARNEHRQLANAYHRFVSEPESPSVRTALLKKLAQLLYIGRSNIAHGEKTPKGPDIQKAERDVVLCDLISSVLIQFFQMLFDQPNHRLALYGTLRRGEANHSLIEEVPGRWLNGVTNGDLCLHDSLPAFTWKLGGESVPVEILISTELPERFHRIDEFEGSNYARIWIPVQTADGLQICNIYSDSRP